LQGLEYWLEDAALPPEPQKTWGGNRIMQKVNRNAFKNGFKVKDAKHKNKLVLGIPVITYVNYIVEWK
jgi:hypothetical protein